MPYSVSLPLKYVVINKSTTLLMNMFHEVLRENKIDSKNGAVDAKVNLDGKDLALGDIVLRQGITYKIANLLENIFETQLGARRQTLNEIKGLPYDPPALALQEAYIVYLNSLIMAMGIGPGKTELEEINDPFVLVREILIRIVTVALCTDMNASRDGDAVIAVLFGFIQKINQHPTNLLADTGFLGIGDYLSVFNKHFVTEHGQWIEHFKQMVKILKFIHLPNNTISSALKYLKAVKISLQRHVVAFLKPDCSPDALSENWINTTFNDCQRELLGEVETFGKALIVSDYRDDARRRDKLIGILETEWKSKEEQGRLTKVKNYSLLLNRTHFVLRIVEEFNFLIATTGWVAIITGTINITELTKLIGSHVEECRELISTLKPNDPVFNCTAGKALTKDKIRVGSENWEGMNENFGKLQDKKLINQMLSMITGSFNHLYELQQQVPQVLGVKQKFGFVALEDEKSVRALPSASEVSALVARNKAWEESSISVEARLDELIRQNKELKEKLAKQETAKYSSAPVFYSKNKQKLQGEFKGKTITFDECEAKADGKCGFYSIGVSPDEVVHTLVSLKDKENIRHELAEEIAHEAIAEITDVDAKAVTVWGKDPDVGPAIRAYLAEKHDPKKQQENKIPKALLQACSKRDVYVKYVNRLKEGWLGCKGAKVVAQFYKQPFNLIVWEKDEKAGHIKMRKNDCHMNPALKDVKHIYYTDGYTHFNLLVEANTVGASAAPPMGSLDHAGFVAGKDGKVQAATGVAVGAYSKQVMDKVVSTATAPHSGALFAAKFVEDNVDEATGVANEMIAEVLSGNY